MATTPQALRDSSSLSSPPSSFVQHSGLGLGLRFPLDRFALKSSFFNGGPASSLAVGPLTETEHKLTMRVAAKGAYICRDCGYIYSDRKPFEKLPIDYSCPVCGAPKRRFKPYDSPVAKNANQLDVRKARKAQIKQDDSLGNALPVGIAVGILVLIGTYLYVNSQF